MATAILDKRSHYTSNRLVKLKSMIRRQLSASESRRVFGNHTCVYATGSMGRLDASRFSDLDAFILRADRAARASQLDALLIQSAVLRASRQLGFPDPDGDGKFMRMHTLSELLENLGKPEDDALNTFTARMLLLLESKPLCNDALHAQALKQIVTAYWRYSKLHPGSYLPLVLLNDIIRYWRIVLLNYEAKNKKASDATALAAEADRRLRSYKLRFSRCLICYSTIAALLLESRASAGNVRKSRVMAILQRTPIERLQSIAEGTSGQEQAHARRLLDLYARFLKETARDKRALLRMFRNKPFRSERSAEARDFGQTLFALIESLGRENQLYRYVVI